VAKIQRIFDGVVKKVNSELSITSWSISDKTKNYHFSVAEAPEATTPATLADCSENPFLKKKIVTESGK